MRTGEITQEKKKKTIVQDFGATGKKLLEGTTQRNK